MDGETGRDPNHEPDPAAELSEVLTGMDRYVKATRGVIMRRVGRRGGALLFFAFLDLVYCYGLISPGQERPVSYRFIASVAPLWLWGALWGIAGVLCLINAFRAKDKVGFAAAIAVKVMWGLLYLIGGFIVDLPRAYLSATIWLCVAAWVAIISSWPEPPYAIIGRVITDPRAHSGRQGDD